MGARGTKAKVTTLYIWYRWPLTESTLDGFSEMFKQAGLNADIVDHCMTSHGFGFLIVHCKNDIPQTLVQTLDTHVHILDHAVRTST